MDKRIFIMLCSIVNIFISIIILVIRLEEVNVYCIIPFSLSLEIKILLTYLLLNLVIFILIYLNIIMDD